MKSDIGDSYRGSIYEAGKTYSSQDQTGQNVDNMTLPDVVRLIPHSMMTYMYYLVLPSSGTYIWYMVLPSRVINR